MVASTFGDGVDPSKGHILASILYVDGNGDLDFLSAARVTLDTSYDVAVATDTPTLFGVVQGNEIINGGVTFLNVDIGTVSVSVDLPDDYATCYVYPVEKTDDRTAMDVETVADVISRVSFVCE